MARTYGAKADQHRFTLVNQMTGAFSIGAWVRRTSNTTWDTVYNRTNSSGVAKFSIQFDTNSFPSLEIVGQTERQVKSLTVKSEDGWVFIGVDKATGIATARLHLWKQASGWTHANFNGTQGNPENTGASSTVRIGEWQGGSEDNFSGDIEVVVEYNGAQLADADWESAAFSRSGMLAKRPTGLWELRQASVEQKVPDLSGTGMNESTRSGTSVATRSCPFYFTGGAPLRSVQPSAAGGQALTLELADSAAFSESRGDGVGSAQTDSLALAETLARAFGLSRADSLAVVEGLSRSPSLGQVDQLVLSDTLAQAFGLSPADALAVADALSRRAGLIRDEVLDVEDLLTSAWAARRELADGVDAVDAEMSSLAKVLAEGVALSDAAGLGVSHSALEGIALLDLLELAVRHVVEENLGLSESIARSLGLSLADTVALLDQVEGAGAAGSALEDVLKVGEQRQVAVNRVQADGALLSDSVAKAASRPAADSLGLSEAHAAVVGHLQADSVALGDSIAKSSTHVESDAIAFSESIGKQIATAVSDALAVVEQLAKRAMKFVGDLFGLSEALEADGGENPEQPAYLALVDLPATALAVVDCAATVLTLLDRPATDLKLLHQPTTYLTLEDEPHV